MGIDLCSYGERKRNGRMFTTVKGQKYIQFIYRWFFIQRNFVAHSHTYNRITVCIWALSYSSISVVSKPIVIQYYYIYGVVCIPA